MTAFRGFLLHSTLLLWAAWALAQVPLSRISTGGVCSSEVVTLRTADEVRLQGIVFRVSKPRASALLLVHGYAGNFYEAYFPELAAAAAHAGYDTLALNMRDHDAGAKMYSFTDNQADIAAGAAYLRGLGHPDIAATVLVSGPGNLFEWNVWQFGREKAQATVDEALTLQRAGREQDLMLVDLGPMGKSSTPPVIFSAYAVLIGCPTPTKTLRRSRIQFSSFKERPTDSSKRTSVSGCRWRRPPVPPPCS